MLEQTRTRITAEEYFQLPETNLPIELIDGEIFQMPTPSPKHQDVILNAAILFRQRVKERGGRVFVAPLDVVFDDGNIAQPDVMWLAPDSRCQVTEKRLVGAPDFIAEVLSPSSVSHDRRTKFRLYQQHGVREYWVIDPQAQLIDVFTLVEGRFQLIGIYGADEVFQSPLLGEIAVREIFPAEAPQTPSDEAPSDEA
ncbi:MAG: Uma2 family endonuclease [bacterium]|nr:Uma2 family endonuclease [bacterium]